MNYEAVFIVLLLIAFVAPVTLAVPPGSGAHLVAVVVARTFVLAAGAVLVVVTVPLLSNAEPGFEGNAVASFVGALLVSALCLGCERSVVVRRVAPITS